MPLFCSAALCAAPARVKAPFVIQFRDESHGLGVRCVTASDAMDGCARGTRRSHLGDMGRSMLRPCAEQTAHSLTAEWLAGGLGCTTRSATKNSNNADAAP
jgi:hypothetical protein